MATLLRRHCLSIHAAMSSGSGISIFENHPVSTVIGEIFAITPTQQSSDPPNVLNHMIYRYNIVEDDLRRGVR